MRAAIWILSVLTFAAAVPVLAQDPGLPDSIIIGSAHVDSVGDYQTVNVPVYVVTDDSVTFYCVPLKWWAPRGGISISTRTAQYFYPLMTWDEHYDTAFTAENYVLQIGWADLMADTTPDPPLLTLGRRLQAWTLRFIVAPNTPPQLVVLDTCWDFRNGGLAFGLVDGLTQISPAFQRGFIRIEWPWDVDEQPGIPREFSLAQNYPNPFNAATTINFALPRASRVRLEIFDLLGRRVAVLADGEYEAELHTVTWDAGGFPSGTYAYRFSAGSFTETKKMILLK